MEEAPLTRQIAQSCCCESPSDAGADRCTTAYWTGRGLHQDGNQPGTTRIVCSTKFGAPHEMRMFGATCELRFGLQEMARPPPAEASASVMQSSVMVEGEMMLEGVDLKAPTVCPEEDVSSSFPARVESCALPEP